MCLHLSLADGECSIWPFLSIPFFHIQHRACAISRCFGGPLAKLVATPLKTRIVAGAGSAMH